MTPTVPRRPRRKRPIRAAAVRPGGGIVDADIVQAPRARRVRNQGHDPNAAVRRIVDGGAHLGVIERDGGDAVVGRRQGASAPASASGSKTSTCRTSMKARWLASQSAVAAYLLVEVRHERIGAGRQDEGETEGLIAGQPGRRRVGTVAELGQRRLDPGHRLAAHAVAPIDHAVDGRQRHAGGAGDVLQGRLEAGRLAHSVSAPPTACRAS